MVRISAVLVALVVVARLLMCRVPVMPGVGVPIWGLVAFAASAGIAAVVVYLARSGHLAFRSSPLYRTTWPQVIA
jgi:hypothetical protein